MSGEMRAYRSLDAEESLEAGEEYQFEGIYYRDWEESGLITEQFMGFEVLDLQKLDAFCVLTDEVCFGGLDVPDRAARHEGTAVASVAALVEFVGPGGRHSDVARNQCRRGTLRVKRIKSIRWR